MRAKVLMVGVALVALVVAGWALTAEAQKQDQQAQAAQVTLKVEGMTCGGCAASVKMAAKRVDGVNDANVSHEKGTAEITYDPKKTSPSAIAKAITENSGFKASVPKEGTSKPGNDSKPKKGGPSCC